MNLTKTLKHHSYDLIQGPIRNHKLLQLWLKKPAKRIREYHTNISDAFESDVILDISENPALNINYEINNEYNFKIGISILQDLLTSLGLGALDIKSEIKTGKKVKISYDNSITREVPIGDVQHYLQKSDFNYIDKNLLKNANKNNIIVVNGVLLAKNLIIEIDTDFNIDNSVIANINSLVDGRIETSIASNRKLKMVSSGNDYFPIAVKAERIDFDYGHFDTTRLVTGNFNFF